MVGKVKELLGDVRASFQWLWFAPSRFWFFFSRICKLYFLYCLLYGISIFFFQPVSSTSGNCSSLLKIRWACWLCFFFLNDTSLQIHYIWEFCYQCPHECLFFSVNYIHKIKFEISIIFKRSSCWNLYIFLLSWLSAFTSISLPL